MEFQKYGKTPLEALLHHLPKGYKNTFLSTSLQIGKNVVLEVEVLDYKPTKPVRVSCYSKKFDCHIMLIIFHAKPYHRATFKPHATLNISGKLQPQGLDVYSIIQPKILTQINEIVVSFGKVGAQERTLREFAKSITLKSLLEFYPTIPREILSRIMKIYQPDEQFIEDFESHKGFFGESLEALKFIEIYEYMRLLRTKKFHFEGLTPLNGAIDSWIQSLPFALTQGQRDAICDIKESLKSNSATRRVIVGDVGCGKTIVILAAVMIAYPKKSVLMAPTSILAQQLFQEAQRFLPSAVKIGLLTQRTKENLQCDFLIGTHALLYQELNDFALVMIDEQHRFGTAQRNALEKMLRQDSKRAHILQFSATPIPRTQAMIESNFLDFSFIRDLPFKKDITTCIIGSSDFKNLLEHIQREITEQHQIIIVYPLVEEGKSMPYTALKEGENFWKSRFSGVYCTHGKDKNKEQILEEFKKKGTILLATTVIEVGISLPNLSTIIIVGAERGGRATLHQLRGRVSRNGLKGYCFLFTKHSKTERLEEFAKTQNGFEIAQLDLKYRSSGDLLGGESQSGKQFEWVDLAEDEEVIKCAKTALDCADSS